MIKKNRYLFIVREGAKNTLGGFMWGKKYNILGVERESTPYCEVGVGVSLEAINFARVDGVGVGHQLC